MVNDFTIYIQPSRDSDYSNLDKGSRGQSAEMSGAKQPSPKKHLPATRTHSSPLVNPEDILPKFREHKEPSRNRKMIRSSSNPDLLAVNALSIEFKDDSDSDDVILPSRNSTFHSSLRNSGVHEPPANVVRYSQNTVDSAANAIEELLTRTEPQSPSHHSHFRPFASVLQKRAKKKEERKKRKSRKLSSSMENVLDEKEISMGSGDNSVDVDRCTSTSPPSESPRVSRKNSKSGSGIFKRAGRSKTKEQLPKTSSSKEPSISPPHHVTVPPSLVNGGGHFDKLQPSKRANMRSSSASHPVVSRPTLINQEPELSHFDLEGLVKQVDKNWIKCGYLWLRMKLPNNRYAWTHIVSLLHVQSSYMYVHMCTHDCTNVCARTR